MHILCTSGTPVVGTLDHLPPLPLLVEYPRNASSNLSRFLGSISLSKEDELGIYHAIRLRDRVRKIDLHIPPSILHKFLVLMGESFLTLEHLSLSFTVDEIATLILPNKFLAPNLYHLSLIGIRLPKRLRLLSSAFSLVTLVLEKIGASGYFRPRILVARLRSLPQLEQLSIGFSIPIPRPSAEGRLLGERGTPVMLSNLKILIFRGVNAYLECLVSQIMAPLLERLDVTVFNQIAFTMPHLSYFVNGTKKIKYPSSAVVLFGDEASIILGHRSMKWSDSDVVRFTLHVLCKPIDWQIDCAAQICSAIMPALSGVETLTLNYICNGWSVLTESDLQSNEIEGTAWHDLFRPFIGAKVICIDHSLSEELSRALEADGIGSNPGFLTSLQKVE